MSWHCAAIDHGVTIYSNGEISPCCLIDHSYRKPLSLLGPDVFADLRQQQAPAECHRCTRTESFGMKSYRMMFNSRVTDHPGLQFLDIRNSNRCNLKCRFCYPINSHLIAAEQGKASPLQEQELDDLESLLIQPGLQWLYYTGGEPFINPSHYVFLQKLIDRGSSQNVSLLYNTNLSTLKYKDQNLIDLWQNFSSVTLQASIDAVGDKLGYIRSGAEWSKIENNYITLKKWAQQEKKLSFNVAVTVSILNFWWLPELLEYFRGDEIRLHEIDDPDYLRLSVIPDDLKTQALEIVDEIQRTGYNENFCDRLRDRINNNEHSHLLKDALLQTLLLDKKRNEHLFDLLPFQNHVWKIL